jgi:hypothetical protein
VPYVDSPTLYRSKNHGRRRERQFKRNYKVTAHMTAIAEWMGRKKNLCDKGAKLGSEFALDWSNGAAAMCDIRRKAVCLEQEEKQA